MPRSRQHNDPSQSRWWSMLAGLSFVFAAAGWLIVNEQSRRARRAIIQTLVRWPPAMRRPLSTFIRWWSDHWIDPWRSLRRQVASGASGDVLEIGVGSWPNLLYYPPVTRLVGVEMHRRVVFSARRRARRLRPGAQVVHASPERLPFAAASFDTVVTSLALCNVDDQAATLAEIARVLRPDGHLYFLEHVRAIETSIALVQDTLTPIWRLVTRGCHPNRDTLSALTTAGFTITAIEQPHGPWGPLQPTVYGVAHRVVASIIEIP